MIRNRKSTIPFSWLTFLVSLLALLVFPGQALAAYAPISPTESFKAGQSVGYGRDSESDASVTKSGINTKNIEIRDEEGQLALTGETAEAVKDRVYTSVTTDTAEAHSGALQNNFDRAAVEKELGLQVAITQQFSENVQYVQSQIRTHTDKLSRDAKAAEEAGDTEKAAQLRAEADNWQKGSLILSMVAGGLSAPTDALGGIIAYTLAPAVSYEIGQYFKAAGTEGSMSHIVAHMVLAGAVAAAGGNDVLSAALAAGGAEMVIPVLSQFLYGTTDPEKLTVSQKDTLIALSALTGGLIGGLVGDSTVSGLAGMSAAQNAVENNFDRFYEDAKRQQEVMEYQNLQNKAQRDECGPECQKRLEYLEGRMEFWKQQAETRPKGRFFFDVIPTHGTSFQVDHFRDTMQREFDKRYEETGNEYWKNLSDNYSLSRATFDYYYTYHPQKVVDKYEKQIEKQPIWKFWLW